MTSTLGIDSNLQVGTLKKSHAPCKKVKFSLNPDSNTSFNMSDTIRFTLPIRKNTFLVNPNSYLKFKLTNNTGANLILDNTAGCIIERLEEFSGGNLLSSLSNYSCLYHILYDTKYSTADKIGFSNYNGQALSGINFTANGSGATLDATGLITTKASGEVIPDGETRTYCHSLMSPAYGLLNDKYFPLWALQNGGDARLEITLASAIKAFISADATDTNVVISDVSFELELLECSDMAMAMVADTMGPNGVILHATGFRDYTGTIQTASNGAQTHLINSRYSSLKTLITAYLNNDGDNVSHSTTSRVKPINSYQLRVNSNFVPQRPITDDPTFFIESMLAFHNDPFSLHNKGSISKDDYTAYLNNAGNDYSYITGDSFKNKFFVAQDLSSIHGKDSLIMAGVSTLNNPVFTDIVLSRTTISSLFVVNYAEFDLIIQIENGVAKVRF